MKHIEDQIRERKAALEQVDAKAAELRDALQQIQMQRMVLVAEIGAYEDALEHAAPKGRRRSAKPGSTTRKRSLSAMWRDILGFLATHFPEEVAGDDLREWAADRGYEVLPENLRSQMSIYKSKGWISSGSPGHYAITMAGASENDIQLKTTQGNDDSESANNADGVGQAASPQSGPYRAAETRHGLVFGSGLPRFIDEGGKK